MTTLGYSNLLTELIEYARGLGKPHGPFSAEKFLVALIDKTYLSEPDSEELAAAKGLLEEAIKDKDAAREALMSHICDKSNTGIADDVYMKKAIKRANDNAVKIECIELDTVSLLLSVLQEPTETIEKLLADKSIPTQIGDGFEEMLADFESSLKALLGDDMLLDEEDEEELSEDIPLTEEELTRADSIKQRHSKYELNKLISEVKHIRTTLHSGIFGQDNAINVFATGYFQACLSAMMDDNKKRPRATFLFAGPPGVGKTFLAEKVAETLDLPYMRFDMSEYADKEANIEFCGSDKVYKNGKEGNVTGFVSRNSKCVLLFDEIEKAHLCVIHLFLQMLDAGRLRDNYTDEEVSFADAIIIITTNAGKKLYEESESGDLSAVSRKVVIKALQTDANPETGVPYFPAAICSRFASGNVVMFNHIGAHNLRTIARNEILKRVTELEKKTGIRFSIDERVYTALLFAEGGAADARTIRSRAEKFFNDELYELLRLIASEKVETEIKHIESISISIDLDNAKENIKELFVSTDKPKALVFADDGIYGLCRDKAPEFNFVSGKDVKTAVKAIKDNNIDFVLIDMKYGAPASSSCNLNTEDVDSPARDFFKYLKEQRHALPVYLIESEDNILNEEEKISFMRQGVRGTLSLAGESFATQLDTIATVLHQQASMISLATANKVVTFETAQSVSNEGKNAEIKLFDFGMIVAVDSEDAKNILSSVSRPNVRFDDVIGASDAKKELKYFVNYLKDPKKYMGTGVKAPRGLLLYGPPGTGKTMLAKAMACEAGVTFIAAEGNQFLTKYIGEGAEKVHRLFRTARKYAPAVLFVDEIDAIAKERRGGAAAGSNGEETLTSFLTEMDGFINDPSKPVFVLAATNFEVEPGSDKSLDAALLRRFDRTVYIELPRRKDRELFLKKKKQSNPALKISFKQIQNIAMRAVGMSLADLDSVVELALRSAIREDSTVVTDAIFEEAFETFNGGEAKKWDVSQLERVARHEAGHAFLCWQSGETPSYLTIVARGDHGGYMQHAEQEGKAIYTKDELLARIRTSLGGRAAELAYYGERDGISTGARGDLASATSIATQIVCSYGMDDSFGLAVTESRDGTMTPEVRAAVNKILREQMAEAIRLVNENKGKVDALVNELLAKNHLNSAEINKILSK